MKKEVNLCEQCYKEGKEIVCDSFCYYCGKTICKDCEKKLIIKFMESEYKEFQNFCITPLCENCLNSFTKLNKEFYQALVNSCGKAFYNELKKQETLKQAIIKKIEDFEK